MKITVIIPVYNAAQYVENALDSILHQTLLPEEIIFINDGSSDNSLKILRELEAKNPIIKVYTQQNAGPSITRNRGVEYSKSEWICFADADDILHPRRIELAAHFSNGHDAIISEYTRFKNVKEISFLDFHKDKLELEESEEAAMSVIKNGYGLPAIFMKRKSFLNAGGLDETLVNNEDFEFNFRMVTHKARFRKLNCSLYFYRQHNSPSRLTQSPARISNSYNALYKMAEQIVNLDPYLLETAKEEIGNRIANNALKDAMSGNKDYKKHLKFAHSLNPKLMPYSKFYLNWISEFFGYGTIEKAIGTFR